MDIDALARGAAKAGLHWAFGVPGGGPSLHLVDRLLASGVQFITTGHESTAALMAGAVGRASSRPAAAVTIKGPGLMNLAPGLLSNAYEGYPMLSFAEAYPGASSSERRHKWLPHERVLSGFVKAIASSGAHLDPVADGWSFARSEFPGPVHFDLVDGDALPPLPQAGDGGEVATVVSRIMNSKRPVLILGSLAIRAPWRPLLRNLRLPVLTTVSAKGVVDEAGPFAAGIYTGDGTPLTPEKLMLAKADLVVTIGVRAGEVLNPAVAHASVVALDAAVSRSRVFPPGDPASVLYAGESALGDVLQAMSQRSWGEDLIRGALESMTSRLHGAWSPAPAFERAMSIAPKAVHVLDTGNFTVIGEHVLLSDDEHRVLGTPNGRYMGFGVGYALGTALGHPGRPVLLWIGDGGIRAFFSELALAVEHDLTLLVVLMADGFFGSVRGRAVSQGWSEAPLRMTGRDMLRAAEGLGLLALRAANEDTFVRSLTSWAAHPRPALLQCDFDADSYGRVASLLR